MTCKAMMRATAVAAMLLAMSACGSGTEPASRPDAGPSPSPSTRSTAEEPLPCVPGAEPFAGPAADEFTPERVMAAYCLLADLATEQAGTSLALPVPEQKARDVKALLRLLTDEARTRWPRLVRDRASQPSALDGLTLHDVRRVPRGYQRADDGPYVFGTKVGPATAGLEGGALTLTFALDTALVLEEKGDDDGRHSLLPVTRTGTYVLVPDGDTWLVDDWDATFERGQVRLAVG